MQPPSLDAQAHSQKVCQHIANQIQKTGPIPFSKFMELALYAPNLGYYQVGTQKFGASGDFVTAPEISPAFGHCIARQIQQIFQSLNGGDILEFGAGSGKLAADILTALKDSKHLPQHYYILEISAELQARQKIFLQEKIPDLIARVIWLTQLPENFTGVMLANEVLDAMPVRRFTYLNHELQEHYVDWNHEKFHELYLPADDALIKKVQTLLPDFDETYTSEINPYLEGWLKSIAECLTRGVVLLIDYGFPRHEYYHPQRHMGTLMCHYQHQAHTDPFWWPGLQDITAHVDFTAVAEGATSAGLEIAGYTTQAHFLLGCGITDMAGNMEDPAKHYQIAQGLKRLLLPSEMGELFKVMALSKNYSDALLGFSLQNMREKL